MISWCANIVNNISSLFHNPIIHTIYLNCNDRFNLSTELCYLLFSRKNNFLCRKMCTSYFFQSNFFFVIWAPFKLTLLAFCIPNLFSRRVPTWKKNCCGNGTKARTACRTSDVLWLVTSDLDSIDSSEECPGLHRFQCDCGLLLLCLLWHDLIMESGGNLLMLKQQ